MLEDGRLYRRNIVTWFSWSRKKFENEVKFKYNSYGRTL